MNPYSLLAFLMFILTVAVLFIRYTRTRVAATPLNLFALQSLLPLFFTYQFVRIGVERIGWGGFSDIIRASNEALLVCSFGTVIFLASMTFLPPLVARTPHRANRVRRPHPANRYETYEAYAASLLMLFGASCLWLTFMRTGIIPLLSPIPGIARTFAGNFSAYQSVRPVYQAGNAILSISSTYIIAWCLIRRREGRLPIFVIVALGFSFFTLLLTANRSWALGPILSGFLLYACINWRRIGLGKIAAFGMVLVVLALGLQAVRWGGSLGRGLANAPYEIVQGDTFSDFRDFSWLLTEYNRKGRELYYGKTILAGYMGMIPSSISSFRMEYAWGRVSADIANLDPEKHFGLRPGPFGEWYFNFGWLGVVFQAMLLGLAAGLVDNRVIRLAKEGNPDRWSPGVFPVFLTWTLFGMICGPLILSSAGPGLMPKIGALIGIKALAQLLRDASPKARFLAWEQSGNA